MTGFEPEMVECGLMSSIGLRALPHFTLVAVGVFVMAMGAFAHHIAVGKELPRLLIVELLALFLNEFSLVVEFPEEVGCELVVNIAGGAAVDVERDAKFLERIFDHLVIAVTHILRGDVLFLGTQRDGHSVLVASSDKNDFFFLQPKRI